MSRPRIESLIEIITPRLLTALKAAPAYGSVSLKVYLTEGEVTRIEAGTSVPEGAKK